MFGFRSVGRTPLRVCVGLIVVIIFLCGTVCAQSDGVLESFQGYTTLRAYLVATHAAGELVGGLFGFNGDTWIYLNESQKEGIVAGFMMAMELVGAVSEYQLFLYSDDTLPISEVPWFYWAFESYFEGTIGDYIDALDLYYDAPEVRDVPIILALVEARAFLYRIRYGREREDTSQDPYYAPFRDILTEIE